MNDDNQIRQTSDRVWIPSGRYTADGKPMYFSMDRGGLSGEDNTETLEINGAAYKVPA